MTQKTKFIVAFDTICDGWQCVQDGEGNPVLYDTEAEAQADCEERYDEFVIPAHEYIHGRKAFFTGNGVTITGTPYSPSS